MIADLTIGLGPFRESFTSHVLLERPRQVRVNAIDGPLEHLTNRWTFTPTAHGTHVYFVIDFQFKSHLLDHAASSMFNEAASRMMSASESRVHLVHAMHQRAAWSGLHSQSYDTAWLPSRYPRQRPGDARSSGDADGAGTVPAAIRYPVDQGC
jgi:hypothetical protein